MLPIARVNRDPTSHPKALSPKGVLQEFTRALQACFWGLHVGSLWYRLHAASIEVYRRYTIQESEFKRVWGFTAFVCGLQDSFCMLAGRKCSILISAIVSHNGSMLKQQHV